MYLAKKYSSAWALVAAPSSCLKPQPLMLCCRWTELHSVLLDHAEAAALPKGRWQRLKDRMLCRLPKVVIPGNIYNWGFWQNSYDVLFPYRRLAEALAAPAPAAAIPAAAPPPAAGLHPREGAPAAGSSGSPEAGLNYMVDDKNHKAGRRAQTSSGLQRRQQQ